MFSHDDQNNIWCNYENQNNFLCVKFLIEFLKLFAETLLLVLSPLLFLREFNSGFSSPSMCGWS